MNPLCLTSTFLISLLFCATGHAELRWEETMIELHPAIGDKEAVAHFKYRNESDKPVHFKSVRTSCGCTVAKSKKDELAPEEKGEIIATFNIGDRTGIQQKSVIVETDDPANSTTVLTLKAVVPETLEIKPVFVYWEGGQERNAKTIVVRAGNDFPVKELTVTSSSPDFLTKIQPGSAPGEFTIEVEPMQTTRAASATLTIEPKDSGKLFYFRAQVFNPPAGGQ